MPHARPRSNLETLDALARLFAAREPIPGSDERPEITPHVASLEFPRALLEERIVAPRRVETVRSAPGGAADGGMSIRYAAPWHDSALVESESVDL